jgi:transcriptional regulator with XRE-family HTH domain
MQSDRESRIVIETVKYLKARRLEIGMSHELLASKAGISRPAVSHIENGKRRPSLVVALKISHALGIELSKALCESNPK